MTVLIVLVALAVGAYLVAVLESWAVYGRLEPARPAISALALLGLSLIHI